MLAAVDWANLTHAGAFLVGAALATVATLRVVKHVVNYFASVERQRDDEPKGGSDGP